MAKTNKAKDNFLRNVVIGMVVVLGALIGVVLYSGATNPTYTYEDFEQIGQYDLMGSMDSDLYAVYMYSESCSHCIAIKTQVMAFGGDNKLGIELFLADTGQTSGTNASKVFMLNGLGVEVTLEEYEQAISDYSNGLIEVFPYSLGTPSMFVFKDNQLVAAYAGSDQIPAFFDGVKNGSITFD